MNTPLLQAPYLREQRQFPSENINELARQTDHAYIDIASKVNARTIGIYATNFPVITGEQWYLQGQPRKQQTLRQVYQINSFTNFAHGIDFSSVSTFTVIRGIGFNGSIYYPLPYVLATNAAQNVGLLVNSTQIQFDKTGTPPVIVSGIIILEWLSQF